MNRKQHFKVRGAGEIIIKDRPYMFGDGEYALDIGVSWGKYGSLGGNIPVEEAKRMAMYILKKCEETTISGYQKVDIGSGAIAFKRLKDGMMFNVSDEVILEDEIGKDVIIKIGSFISGDNDEFYWTNANYEKPHKLEMYLLDYAGIN